jgi:hypothetical protein
MREKPRAKRGFSLHPSGGWCGSSPRLLARFEPLPVGHRSPSPPPPSASLRRPQQTSPGGWGSDRGSIDVKSTDGGRTWPMGAEVQAVEVPAAPGAIVAQAVHTSSLAIDPLDPEPCTRAGRRAQERRRRHDLAKRRSHAQAGTGARSRPERGGGRLCRHGCGPLQEHRCVLLRRKVPLWAQ